jgi:hypothetical protein
MVATRAAARKQQGAEPAPPANTLKAPPKRAGRKKAAPEPETEPEPKPKRAAAAAKPAAKATTKAAAKPAAKTKKAEPKTEPAPEPKKAAAKPRKAAAASKKVAAEPKKAAPAKKAAVPKQKAAPKPKAPARAGKRATRATVPEPSPEPAAIASPEAAKEEPAELPAETFPEPDIVMEEAPVAEAVENLEPVISPQAAQTPEPEPPVAIIAMPALSLFPPPSLSAPMPSPSVPVSSSPAPISPLAAPVSSPPARLPSLAAPVSVSPVPRPAFFPAPIPSLSAPVMTQPESPIKSALRSPQKAEESPKKKTVTFNAHPYSAFESSLLVADGPLTDTIFYLDIKSRGRSENHIFVGLLEDMGAQVIRSWESKYVGPTHVLFKEGSPETLQKVIASNGTVKCVNVGFAIDCEKHNKRMDESDYLVDLQPAAVPKTPEATNKRLAYTPARTPSHFFSLKTPSTGLSTPTTPTSSEWDRSILYSEIDDKENAPADSPPKPVQRSAPAKPQTMFNWIGKSPIKPMTVARPLASAARKRKLENFGGITMAPPKKLRFD